MNIKALKSQQILERQPLVLKKSLQIGTIIIRIIKLLIEFFRPYIQIKITRIFRGKWVWSRI